MVLIWSTWSIHGFGRGCEDGSRGRLVLRTFSCSAVNFQTTSLLSLPCLQDHEHVVYKTRIVVAYVMMRSCPQPAMPSMEAV